MPRKVNKVQRETHNYDQKTYADLCLLQTAFRTPNRSEAARRAVALVADMVRQVSCGTSYVINPPAGTESGPNAPPTHVLPAGAFVVTKEELESWKRAHRIS